MKTIVVSDPSVFEGHEPGDRVYLISWFNDSEPRCEQFLIQSEIPVTNQGLERAEGWLGSTNNINETAHGLYEIESLELIERLSPEKIAGSCRLEPVATKIKLFRVND